MEISNKKIKTPFVMSCPKSLCCQKMHFGPLGVNKKYLIYAKPILQINS